MPNSQHTEIAATVQRMADGLAAKAPKDWRRAVVRAFATEYGQEFHRVWYALANGRDRLVDTAAAPWTELSELADRVRTSTPVAIELVVHASGEFEALIAAGLSRRVGEGRRVGEATSVQCVLTPGVLPERRGDEQPGPTNPTQAGDPAEAVQLFHEYLRLRAEILGRADDLPAPLAPEVRQRLEQDLGVALPEDLRALYALANGDDNLGLLVGHPWSALQDVVGIHTNDRWWVTDDDGDRVFAATGLQPDSVVCDADPPHRVRRSLDRPGWVPFAISTGGDFLAVDMDPTRDGRPGQVIRIGLHHDDGPSYLADSVTTLLRWHVEALRRGDYEHYEDGDNQYLEVTSADLARWADSRRDRQYHQVRLTGPDASLARLDPVTQVLTVTDGGAVDLDPVRRAPNLWQVRLVDCASTDLTPLRELPVEVLDLGVRTVDLAPLAGHPTLRVLVLRGASGVDLAPLRGLPSLFGLDLSGADVHDIAAVADLPGLRQLTLRPDQWRELSARTDRLPALAAADLTGDPSPQEIVAWLTRLGAADRVQHHVGRLTPRD
ncbi:SMI1/KNR4 family protein [Goodfellowiella coeruleoviolacea]|uniref:SMI1 / KNR4 family (SUKH-1) n=1 Tax=Goodfellowiella coeruleoviolacea TaxID=334858 RepID=A0AAE3KJ95_9PSEU|nr:SMI1/KNR4 family protein [Goodfellowiella coeruleoviolacea]MCP2170031.1 SMI1 / KNR4 family (SUKH-1) [Goodfellowiella coeruleoviolacea]